MEIKTSDNNVGYATGRVGMWGREGSGNLGRKILFSREMLLSLSCLRVKLRLRLRRTAGRNDGKTNNKKKTKINFHGNVSRFSLKNWIFWTTKQVITERKKFIYLTFPICTPFVIFFRFVVQKFSFFHYTVSTLMASIIMIIITIIIFVVIHIASCSCSCSSLLHDSLSLCVVVVVVCQVSSHLISIPESFLYYLRILSDFTHNRNAWLLFLHKSLPI